MAKKMTNAQARKRLREASAKLMKIVNARESFPSAKRRQLFDIANKLLDMQQKMK